MSRSIGVVLAGGLSSRMGQDKSMLMLDKQTLLQRQIEVLSFCDEVWVSGRSFGEYRCIKDNYPRRGPVGALQAICQMAANENVAQLICLPVDLPCISATALQHLQMFAAPVSWFKAHPLPACIRAIAEVERCATQMLQDDSAEASVRQLWQRVGAEPSTLSSSFERELVNTNTPEEWRAVTQPSAH